MKAHATMSGSAGLAAAALSAAASVACWALPLALVSAGVTGAWMSNFTVLAPYKAWLIAAALACLGFAGVRIYRASPAGGRLPRALFWVVSALVLAAIASPYLVPLLIEA